MGLLTWLFGEREEVTTPTPEGMSRPETLLERDGLRVYVRHPVTGCWLEFLHRDVVRDLQKTARDQGFREALEGRTMPSCLAAGPSLSSPTVRSGTLNAGPRASMGMSVSTPARRTSDSTPTPSDSPAQDFLSTFPTPTTADSWAGDCAADTACATGSD